MLERERDRGFERRFADIATRAAGLTSDAGLRAFSDARTLPGPIKVRDFKQDAAEEIADLLNYATWQAEAHYDGYLAGDAHQAGEYARYMDIASGAIALWHRLLSA